MAKQTVVVGCLTWQLLSGSIKSCIDTPWLLFTALSSRSCLHRFGKINKTIITLALACANFQWQVASCMRFKFQTVKLHTEIRNVFCHVKVSSTNMSLCALRYVLFWIIGNGNYIYNDKQCSDFERIQKVQLQTLSLGDFMYLYMI